MAIGSVSGQGRQAALCVRSAMRRAGSPSAIMPASSIAGAIAGAVPGAPADRADRPAHRRPDRRRSTSMPAASSSPATASMPRASRSSTSSAPNEEWARQLHGFGWLRHLRAADMAISRSNARSLVDEWIRMSRPPRRDRLGARRRRAPRHLLAGAVAADPRRLRPQLLPPLHALADPPGRATSAAPPMTARPACRGSAS